VRETNFVDLFKISCSQPFFIGRILMKQLFNFLMIVLAFVFLVVYAIQAKDFSPRPDDDCVRGAARPIVKRSVFPKSRFKLQPDKLTGVETVKFKNGDKLVITTSGCEYYVLTFRFETARFNGSADDFPFWFGQAIILMREVEKGIDAPIDIAKGIDAMEREVDRRRNSDQKELEPGDEIDFTSGEMNDFVVVDKIEKLNNNLFAVEISFAKGPL